MKHLKTTFVIALVLCALSSSGEAQIKGSSMGNLISVVTDGPFDAGRNPALLSLQTADSAAGAYVRYRVIDNTDLTYKSPLPMDLGELSTVNAGGVAAYSMKFSGSVLGFAIGEIGGDLVSLRKSRATYIPMNEEREKEEVFEAKPSLALALAFPLTDASSIGFQLITTAGYKRTDKPKDYFNAGNPIASLDTYHKTEQSISARAGFGYSMRTQHTQVGLVLNSGTASLQRQELEYKHTEYDIAAPILSGKDSTPSKIYYTESPQFTVGGYHRLFPELAFAIEAAYTLPGVSYGKERDLNINVTNGVNDILLPVSRNYTITTDAALLFKGGIEYTPREGLAFTLGGGYDYRKISNESQTSGHRSIRSTIELWYAMLGAHYALTADTGISLLVTSGYVRSEAEFDLENLYSLRLDSTVFIFDTGIAVSTRY